MSLTMEKWKGHEDELFEALELKYGALDESEDAVATNTSSG